MLVMAVLLAQFNMLPVVHADDLSGDFYYIENADTTSVTITGYTDTAPRDHVVIPQMIDGKSVTAIGDGAFQSKSIQSLELPDGLVSIGRLAFQRNLLTSLEIPGSVKSIGNNAFSVNALTSLTIHDGVETIGNSAFNNNQLTVLSLPNSVTTIGAYAFFTNNISSLELPEYLVEINEYSFSSNKLTNIDIPGSVEIIGDSAFIGNRILELEIPATVTTIGDRAFFYNALTVVTFLGTPTLGSNVFGDQYLNGENQYMYNWYTDNEYTQLWNNTVSDPSTIYTAWTRNRITFESNGGSRVSNRFVTFGQMAPTVMPPTKTEHTFAGWFKETELIHSWDFNTDTVIRNITLYAKWIPNTYTVSFNSNGGTSIASQTIAYDAQVIPPANPTREGYAFDGWYTDSGFTTAWNFDTSLVKTNTTLYAKWITHSYTVNFQTNGGTLVAAQTIAHDEKVVFPATPSRTGYTLEGWYTDSELTTAWNFNTNLVQENMTLYAKWTVNTYTVSFQTNGGTEVDTQTVAFENKVSLPVAPIKAEHSFEGWYTDSGLTAAWNFDYNVVLKNMTLYAKWTLNTYLVNFQSNGGSNVESQQITYDGRVTSPVDPSKVGYIFDGWYTNATLTTPWSFSNDLVKESMTLYAKWTANSYEVSFQSAGGTAVDTQTVAYDEKIVLPTNPSKTGHTFDGWYTNTSLTTPWNFSTDLVKENITLYAKWTANTYTVNFHTNNGTAVSEQIITYDNKVVVPTPPTKVGHIFVSWYQDEELTTPWMFDTDVVTEAITLYAKWDKEVYTVSFETSGGSEITDQRISFEETVVQPANPKKSGYTFAGWYKDEGLRTTWNFATDVIITDVRLYAKWSRNNYVTSPEPIIVPEPEPEPEPIPEEEPEQPVCSTKFDDISNHWAEYAITDIASRCIIIGFPDGEFKPNAPLIRSHVAVMFTRALKLPLSNQSNSYYDVSDNSPYYEAIMKASQAGIFEGTNGYFYPDQQLTRAQLAKLLVLAFNLPVGGKSSFLDVPTTHWGYSYIGALESNGLAFGEDGYYKPEEPVTRAEFVAFMYRVLQL